MPNNTYTVMCGGVPIINYANLVFETAIPGGFTIATFIAYADKGSYLDIMHPAFRYNADVSIQGPAGIRWEGVIKRTVPGKAITGITIECVGRWGNARDILLRRAFIDKGCANWEDTYPFDPGTVKTDYTYDAYKCKSEKLTIDKYSRLYITANKATFVAGEGRALWYFVDPAFSVYKLQGTVSYNLPANMYLRIRGIRSAANAYDLVDLYSVDGAASSAGVSIDLTMAYNDYIALGFWLGTGAVTNASEAGTYFIKLTNPVVTYANTSTPLYVSTAVKALLSAFADTVDWSTSTAHVSTETDVEIESLLFDQPVSLPEMMETLNTYVDNIMGVWENKRFEFLPRPADTDVVLTISPEILLNSSLIWDFSDLYNQVYVRYTDENQKTVYVLVTNEDPDNYLNRWEEIRCGAIWLNDSQSDADAVAAGDAFLSAKAYAKPNGTITLNVDKYGYLRAGMKVRYQGGPYLDQVLMITNTRLDASANTIELTLIDDMTALPRTVLRRRRVQRWQKIGVAE